jgi:hypothetical protein
VKCGLKRLGPELAKGGEWSRDEGLTIDGDFEFGAAGGSDACDVKAVFAG